MRLGCAFDRMCISSKTAIYCPSARVNTVLTLLWLVNCFLLAHLCSTVLMSRDCIFTSAILQFVDVVVVVFIRNNLSICNFKKF